MARAPRPRCRRRCCRERSRVGAYAASLPSASRIVVPLTAAPLNDGCASGDAADDQYICASAWRRAQRREFARSLGAATASARAPRIRDAPGGQQKSVPERDSLSWIFRTPRTDGMRKLPVARPYLQLPNDEKWNHHDDTWLSSRVLAWCGRAVRMRYRHHVRRQDAHHGGVDHARESRDDDLRPGPARLGARRCGP